MLIAVQDDGSRYLSPAISAIEIAGGRRIRFGYRGSYALIGYIGRGRKPTWIRQVQNRRRRGPSFVSTIIKLGKPRFGRFLSILFKNAHCLYVYLFF